MNPLSLPRRRGFVLPPPPRGGFKGAPRALLINRNKANPPLIHRRGTKSKSRLPSSSHSLRSRRATQRARRQTGFAPAFSRRPREIQFPGVGARASASAWGLETDDLCKLICNLSILPGASESRPGSC